MATEPDLQRYIKDRSEPEPNSGCWLWLGTLTKGYGRAGRYGRLYLAHRLSYEAFVGPIPDGLLVLHYCDTPCCVRPAHLWVGTDADNNRDMVSKGRRRILKGELNGNAKLTATTASDALVLHYLCGYTQRRVGRDLGVTRETVQKICLGANWKDLSSFRAEILSMAGRTQEPVIQKMANDLA